MKEKEDLCINSEVGSEGAHPLYGALRRRGLDPIQLAYKPNRPELTASAFNQLQQACQQSWSQGLLLCFFPRSHRRYLLHLPTEG